MRLTPLLLVVLAVLAAAPAAQAADPALTVSAQKLRAERLEAARAGRQGQGPGTRQAASGATRKGPAVTGEPTGDRALRSPASEKRRASTGAQGARRQAKRDNR